MTSLRRVLLSLLVLCALSAQAAYQDIETTATGYGKTASEALGDALARAVTQVRGGNASISTGVQRAEVNAVTRSAWGSSSMSATVESSQSADFQGGGAIARYEVLSTEQLAAERFAVKVRAMVHAYEAPSRGSTRDRIAVLPFRAAPAAVDVAGRVAGAELADGLGRALERQLLHSGHFQVLDRASLALSVDELLLAASDLSGPQEKARLQQLRGADYLLIPTLQLRGDAQRRNPVTGQRGHASGDLKLDIRIVVPATGEVVYSGQTPIDARFAEDRDRVLDGIAAQAVAAFDSALNGSTRLAPAASIPEPDVRDARGVRLPFDP